MKFSFWKRGRPTMDIHKPKAAHSLREFLIEIGTITIGILIALGLEAGVEGLRHRELVEHARADFRQELSDNRAGLVRALNGERETIVALNRMTAALQLRLAGKRPAPGSATVNTTFSTMSAAAWESTVATKALSHMSYADAQALAQAYSESRAYNVLQEEARKPFFELTATDSLEDLDHTELRERGHVIALNRSYETALLGLGQRLLTDYDRALELLAD